MKIYGCGIFLMGILIFCCPLNAQNLEVTYTESLKFEFRDHGDDPEMEQLRKSTIKIKTLVYSGGKSLYQETPIEQGINNERMAYFLTGEITVAVFKDQEKRQLIKELDLYSRHFLIRTEGNRFTWKIETGTKKDR